MASSETATLENPEPSREGKVRLRRFAAVMIPSVAAAGVLVALTAQGVLAAQFSISGIPFTITADHLHGDGFEQFATIDNTTAASQTQSATGGQVTVFVSAIRHATLTNLCQSIGLGSFYLVLHAGKDKNNPVVASNLVVDSDSLSAGGSAVFQNIVIGQDATTLSEVPGAANQSGNTPGVNDGNFGQQADQVDIDKLTQNNYATTASTFTLPGLSMSFSDQGC